MRLDDDLSSEIAEHASTHALRPLRLTNQGLGRHSIDVLEQGEADSAWLCRRTTQVDVLWDPSACIATKEVRKKRADKVNVAQHTILHLAHAYAPCFYN